jgi:hypothetical protein
MVSLAGCGEDPTLKVLEEPAGENCPTGGFRIETDDGVFYSCREQAVTEEVAMDAEGNPCFGDALRVTVTLDDGTTRDAYVCQPIVTDPLALDLFLAMPPVLAAQQAIECFCALDPEVQTECEAQIEIVDAIIGVSSKCTPEVLTVIGPFPEADRPVIECMVDVIHEVTACYDAIDVSECSPEAEAAVVACEEMTGDIGECGTPSEALTTWMQHGQAIGEFLGCPIITGGL